MQSCEALGVDTIVLVHSEAPLHSERAKIRIYSKQKYAIKLVYNIILKFEMKIIYYVNKKKTEFR